MELKTVDINKCFTNKCIRDNKVNPEHFERTHFCTSIPTQYARNKMAHARGWQVTNYLTDFEKKEFVYDVIISSTETERRVVPFADVAKFYNWKSWKFNDNKTEMVFVKNDIKEA